MNGLPENFILNNLSRRGFLKGASATGALVLAASWGLPNAFAEETKYGGEGMPHGLVDDPKVYLSIASDGSVTVICNRSEMGQGIRTSLSMVVADELEAEWAQVKVQQAPGDEVRFGNQNTDGSRSMRHWYEPMRRCGAAARSMLEQAAAAQWQVPQDECRAQQHKVVHQPSGRALGFGELAQAASALPVPPRERLRLKPAEDFRYIGKESNRAIDGDNIVHGKAIYGADVRLDGMVYATIARPRVYGGTVVKYDATEALKVPGVIKVIAIDSSPLPSEFQPLGGIAVIGKHTWAAMKGRDALRIDWVNGPNASYDSVNYRKTLQDAAHKPGKEIRNTGNTEQALRTAASTLEATYYLPHLAQAPMEPMVALALFKDGRCEVWAPVQAPQVGRERIATRLGLSVDQVTVHVTLLGGGFGRKSKPDYMVEAAILAKELEGQPVRVQWTREDDIHHSYFHTVSAEYLKAGLDKGGLPQAWLHRTVAPTITSLFGPNMTYEGGFELGMGFSNTAFAIPNIRQENPAAQAHARIGWYRAVSNIPHAFAIQSFVDELAHKAGQDPLKYQLELLGADRKINPTTLGDTWNYGESPVLYPVDTARIKGVLQAAAKGAGWGRKLAKGRGLGIAVHYSFVTYVAAVLEVEVKDDGSLIVHKADIAVDCGARINPERIRSQLEGACVMGIGNAVLGEITFKDGKAQQDNFHMYEVARINLAPKEVAVHFVTPEGEVPMGGIGEPGIPPIAPALCNAIFAATGKRIRELPVRFQLQDWQKAAS
ncbi:xanthine dehydrogenase family protein molybdopterin-binding subunit [Pseudomonas sp. 5P_3.1_Bac2]|uniref:xanthine dehydrogenase family protein molybdopterin-binding subunit n=1 Tax=Pseudomonas sp. 5P_3.1_Bac2 TaxID=2971617 RepID=UPI0021CA9B67|nr:xanthine dehydrogenase family protein molybdopterin-binding subunit [Pseudomonas sp. 5P_3.1_Bac2]MCU1716611.1 xanthine dehydrogenase family protein molybdopterin-binding subunit [Pseudomonas sp. 5P_3.1_Bac2]